MVPETNEEAKETTRRLDEVLSPYFTRDTNGRIIEELGYLRRGLPWPELSQELIEWSLAYETYPDFTSTSGLHICLSLEPSRMFPERGFYLNVGRHAADLAQLLPMVKENLEKYVPKREYEKL